MSAPLDQIYLIYNSKIWIFKQQTLNMCTLYLLQWSSKNISQCRNGIHSVSFESYFLFN